MRCGRVLVIPDANFRRGRGLMLTGLWVTIFGFAIVLLGGLAIAFGFTGLIIGGIILARRHEVMTTMPPVPPVPPTQPG